MDDNGILISFRLSCLFFTFMTEYHKYRKGRRENTPAHFRNFFRLSAGPVLSGLLSIQADLSEFVQIMDIQVPAPQAYKTIAIKVTDYSRQGFDRHGG